MNKILSDHHSKRPKRESFWRIFFKRLGIGIGIVIALMITTIHMIYKYQMIQFPDIIEDRFNTLRSSLLKQVSDKTVDEAFITVTSHICYAALYWESRGIDCYMAIMDDETSEFITDSSFKGFLLINEKEDTNDFKAYYCDDYELMKNLHFLSNADYKRINPFFESFDISPSKAYDIEYKIQSAYIGGQKFIPDKIKATNRLINLKSGTITDLGIEITDYADEYPSDYELLDLTQVASNMFIISGNQMQIKDVPDTFSSVKGSHNYYDNLKFTRITDFTFTDSSGHSYTLYAYHKTRENFYKINAGMFFAIFAVYMSVMIIIVCILSIITGSRYKYFYMMEDYRKNLINNLAHDLKSPLMSMSGSAENLKENLHTEKREHYADIILENTEYMNKIISDTLQLSKAENPAPAKNKCDTGLCRIAREIIQKYEPIINNKNLNVSIEGEYIVNADIDDIKQAIDNLLSNAVKYTKPDGQILISGNQNEFVIANDSSEQPPDNPDTLWNAFVKGDESRSNKSGSGLGLAIIKTILEKNDMTGKITFENGRFVLKITKKTRKLFHSK